MSGAPTYTVKLDDGTGTFPYTVTSYLRLSDGWSITRGRQDEQGSVSPSTLSLTLENTDGRFTLGSTSGGYGAIDLDRGIQFSLTFGATTVKKFTGYVQSWQVEWPAGGQEFAVVRVTAVDRLARLERQTLRSVVEQEIIADIPQAYYTMGDPEGSTSAAESSGNAPIGPMIQVGTGTDVVFGTSTGPGTDGLTAADTAGGKYLQTALPPMAGSWTFELFFNGAASKTDILGAAGGGNCPEINVTVFGSLETVVNGITLTGGVPGVTSGATTHAAVTYDGVNTVNLYVNGYLTATNAAMGALVPVPRLLIAGVVAISALAHVAVYNGVLSSTRILAHANAGLNGFNTESSDARIARYAGYGGVASGDIVAEAGVLTTTAHLDITGSSVVAAMQRVVDSEGGLLFVRGDGKLVVQNRYHRALQTTADVALTGDDADIGTSVTADLAGIVNYVTATDSNGQVTIAKSTASMAAHGAYPASLDLLSSDPAQVTGAANWLVGKFSTPKQRLGSVTVDLMSMVTSATVQAVMGLEISDRLSFSSMPSQVTVEDQIIEGWTESGSHNSWSITFNTTPFSLYSAWILGDATYGVLDSTTVLHY